MKISCSQIDLPNLGLKCLKMGPKPRQLEVVGSKSLDFTIKKSYIADPFSWWYLWVLLMGPVPKAGFFQVLLVWIVLTLPDLVRKTGLKVKGWAPIFFHINFPRSSFPNDMVTSLDHHHFIWKLMIEGSKVNSKWWSREVLLFHTKIDDRGK